MGLTGCLGGETESMEDVLKMPCTALGRARQPDMIIIQPLIISSELGGYQDRDNLQQCDPEE